MPDTAVEEILGLLVRYWRGDVPDDLEQRNLYREIGERALELLPAPAAREARQHPEQHAVVVREALLRMQQDPIDRALLNRLNRRAAVPSTSVSVIGNGNNTFAGSFQISGNLSVASGDHSSTPHQSSQPTNEQSQSAYTAPPADQIRQTTKLPADATALPQQVDLAVITAMAEELEHVLNLIGGRQQWERVYLQNYTHYYAEFVAGERALSVIACSQGKYGGDETVAAVHRLAVLRPRLLAMTGICAGREGDVELGDVIVAERAFRAEEGKQTQRGFQPDTQTYQPPAWLMHALKGFSFDNQWQATIETLRPISLRYQAQWLLCRMASAPRPYPATQADRQELRMNDINLALAKQWLVSKGWMSAGDLILSEGQRVLEELRLKHDGACLPDPDPKVSRIHYGAFASMAPVIATEEPFRESSHRVRTVRAIDLEVCSLYSSAAALGIPAFAVKGVSDYATPQKDDAFHAYAAEAAARWMYAFMISNADTLLRSAAFHYRAAVPPSDPTHTAMDAKHPPPSDLQQPDLQLAAGPQTKESTPAIGRSTLGKPSWKRPVFALIGLIAAALAIAGFGIGTGQFPGFLTAHPPQQLSYQVRVEARDTGENIPGAKVTIETDGIAPLDQYTDSNGLARVTIDATHAGKRGKLIVEAIGYRRFIQEIDIVDSGLPRIISIERAS